MCVCVCVCRMVCVCVCLEMLTTLWRSRPELGRCITNVYGKDTLPILREAEWAPGPVWMDGKSRPHRDSIPDRPTRSWSLYRLSYPAHIYIYMYVYIYIDIYIVTKLK